MAKVTYLGMKMFKQMKYVERKTKLKL